MRQKRLQTMIQKEDFQRSLSKAGTVPPSHADVTYHDGRVVVYKAQDFDKIRFPVAKAMLKFPQGSRGSIYLGNGDYASKDKMKVRQG